MENKFLYECQSLDVQQFIFSAKHIIFTSATDDDSDCHDLSSLFILKNKLWRARIVCLFWMM